MVQKFGRGCPGGCSAAPDAGGVAGVYFKGFVQGIVPAEAFSLGGGDRLEDALVVLWHDFYELLQARIPVRQEAFSLFAARKVSVPLDEGAEFGGIGRFRLFQADHLLVTAGGEIAFLI